MSNRPPGEQPPRIRLNGRDIYTADNQHVGIIRDMIMDKQTGLRTLVVATGLPDPPLLLIPFADVGVITQSQVMLDVTSQEFEREAGRRYRGAAFDSEQP